MNADAPKQLCLPQCKSHHTTHTLLSVTHTTHTTYIHAQAHLHAQLHRHSTDYHTVQSKHHTTRTSQSEHTVTCTAAHARTHTCTHTHHIEHYVKSPPHSESCKTCSFVCVCIQMSTNTSCRGSRPSLAPVGPGCGVTKSSSVPVCSN